MGHALGNNYGKFYSFLSKPVDLDLNFTVDSTNGNGYGVRSVKGQGVKNVFMATSASMTGTTHSGTNVIDSISGGTSALVVGMPIAGTGIPAGTKILQIVDSGSILVTKNSTGNHSSETITYVAPGSPMVNTGISSASVGYALIELEYNYTRIYAGPSNIVSPSTGNTIAINSTSLTVGQPYIIASVGHAADGTVTIAPVADVSGSLASTWFRLYDSYGNTFIIWFSVSGVGQAPVGVSGTLVQQSISTNDSASTIGTALVVTIENLLAQTPQNPGAPAVDSFTASGTSTVTVVSTQANPHGPLPGAPADGAIPTGFTFAVTKSNSNLENWQAVGVPPGVVPAVGVSFIATSTGQSTGGGSTGLVVAAGVSGIVSIETIGDPNGSLAPIPMGGSPNVGGWILVQFLAPVVTVPVTAGTAGDAVTNDAGVLNSTGGEDLATIVVMTPTAPANNSVISMTLLLEQAARVGGNQE